MSAEQKKTYQAIALIEFNNLADGITAGDAMVKKAPIAMLKAGTVSQGKYLVLIGGSTASVDESYREGLQVGGHSVVDSLLLPDVHPQVHGAVLGERRACHSHALAVVETRTVAAIIQAADAGVKGAQVDIVEMRLADGYGGKGYVLFTGKVEEVEAAVEIGLSSLGDRRAAVSSRIIPALDEKMAREIETGLRFAHSQKMDLPDGEVPDEIG